MVIICLREWLWQACSPQQLPNLSFEQSWFNWLQGTLRIPKMIFSLLAKQLAQNNILFLMLTFSSPQRIDWQLSLWLGFHCQVILYGYCFEGISMLISKHVSDSISLPCSPSSLNLAEDGESDEQVVLVSQSGTVNRIKVRDISVQSRYARYIATYILVQSFVLSVCAFTHGSMCTCQFFFK